MKERDAQIAETFADIHASLFGFAMNYGVEVLLTGATNALPRGPEALETQKFETRRKAIEIAANAARLVALCEA